MSEPVDSADWSLERRSVLLGVLAFVACPGWASANEASVPFDLQARLLGKVAGYDKNFRARAGERAVVLVVKKRKDGGSQRAANQLRKALAELEDIAGLPQEVRITEYSGADALEAEIKKTRSAVVYLTPGFTDEAPTLARALQGVDVLSVSAVAEDVAQRIVLGFGLVSGKPKIFTHLEQARLQRVEFEPRALKLMKVYR